MLNLAEVIALVKEFADAFDGEALKSRDLVLMLLGCTPAPFSRHQFTPGHVTASGLVLAPDGERILLVHHRRLDRWLVPGGHVEPEDDSAGDAARREVVEETGTDLVVRPARLAGIDVHGIPGRGPEPYHLHHDLVFSFQAVSDRFQVSEESRAVAWCHPRDFTSYDIPSNIRRAYHRALASTE